MLDYLTHPKFIAYNPFILPSKNGGGGGMGMKTYFVKEALETAYPNARLISDTAEIENPVVLIEPLRFRMGTDGFERDYETVGALIEGLKNTKSKKILYTSEFTPLVLLPHLRRQLLEVCDVVVASCEFQRSLLRYVGIDTPHIIRDPISDIYCSPVKWKDRESVIVAGGQVAWYKNPHHLIKLFKALKGKVKRLYIGSNSLWYNPSADDKGAVELQNELYSECDEIIRECNIIDLAKKLYRTKYGVWIATHDTTATFVISMFRAGIPVVGAAHGYSDEIPVQTSKGLNAQLKAVEDMLAMNDEEMEIWSEHVSDWAKENASYAAFVEQLHLCMRGV